MQKQEIFKITKHLIEQLVKFRDEKLLGLNFFKFIPREEIKILVLPKDHLKFDWNTFVGCEISEDKFSYHFSTSNFRETDTVTIENYENCKWFIPTLAAQKNNFLSGFDFSSKIEFPKSNSVMRLCFQKFGLTNENYYNWINVGYFKPNTPILCPIRQFRILNSFVRFEDIRFQISHGYFILKYFIYDRSYAYFSTDLEQILFESDNCAKILLNAVITRHMQLTDSCNVKCAINKYLYPYLPDELTTEICNFLFYDDDLVAKNIWL